MVEKAAVPWRSFAYWAEPCNALYLILYGHVSTSDVFLNVATHCNSISLRGDTALIIAATDGYDSIVKLLLEAGADKDTVNEVHSMKNQNTQIW